VLRETTSRGLCGLVCPSHTSERGGEGDCVKEGGEKKGSARGSRGGATTPQPSIFRFILSRCFGRRESDFALQPLVECRALDTERVRLVALRWHSSVSEVRLGLPVGLKKKKTQKLAVHVCACAHDGRERECVCLLLQYLIQSCSRGGRRIVEDMCYENMCVVYWYSI
jgi:hypothetical protein